MSRAKMIVFVLTITLTSCNVFDKTTREYNKKLKHQVIPATILNTRWKLLSATDDATPCYLTLQFHGTGELTFTFKDAFYEGHYLMGTGDEFEHVFVGFDRKVVWTEDKECVTNPSTFAADLNGDHIKFQVDAAELKISGQHNKEFVFKKM
jgi:hypothetical protein